VVLGSAALADWWLFTHGHVTAGLYAVLLHSGFLLATIGLILGGTLFHECGHASACRYGGGQPGGIGFRMSLRG
jgi:putative peptide zinc metalloprotease protein